MRQLTTFSGLARGLNGVAALGVAAMLALSSPVAFAQSTDAAGQQTAQAAPATPPAGAPPANGNGLLTSCVGQQAEHRLRRRQLAPMAILCRLLTLLHHLRPILRRHLLQYLQLQWRRRRLTVHCTI